jgi:hypothetical protein
MGKLKKHKLSKTKNYKIKKYVMNVEEMLVGGVDYILIEL